MFPEELPKRLIKMFSFVGDTVLDPFLGSGTTVKVALELNRNAIGYEINKNFLEIIKNKVGIKENLFNLSNNIQIMIRKKENLTLPTLNYIPRIQDAKPQIDPKRFKFSGDRLYKVVEILNENTIKLDAGLIIKFLGVKIEKKEDTVQYLKDYVLGKNVFLKFNNNNITDNGTIPAYVYLKNKIFINTYLIKSGLASPDFSVKHKYADKFVQLWRRNK